MRTLTTVLALTVLILFVPVTAAAQTALPASPKYNLATETLIKGKVVSIHDRQCPVSGTIGSHFMLEAADGTVYEVHLAPSKFVKTFDMLFSPGNSVEVLGDKLVFQGKNAILAREIKRGHGQGFETFVFRDKKGNPLW